MTNGCSVCSTLGIVFNTPTSAQKDFNPQPKLGYYIGLDGFLWTMFVTGIKHHTSFYPINCTLPLHYRSLSFLYSVKMGWELWFLYLLECRVLKMFKYGPCLNELPNFTCSTHNLSYIACMGQATPAIFHYWLRATPFSDLYCRW